MPPTATRAPSTETEPADIEDECGRQRHMFDHNAKLDGRTGEVDAACVRRRHAAAFGELKFFFPNRLVEPLPSSKQAKEYVAETLTPALTAGLVALCRAKPTNPAEFLAHYLLENNRRAA